MDFEVHRLLHRANERCGARTVDRRVLVAEVGLPLVDARFRRTDGTEIVQCLLDRKVDCVGRTDLRGIGRPLLHDLGVLGRDGRVLADSGGELVFVHRLELPALLAEGHFLEPCFQFSDTSVCLTLGACPDDCRCRLPEVGVLLVEPGHFRVQVVRVDVDATVFAGRGVAFLTVEVGNVDRGLGVRSHPFLQLPPDAKKAAPFREAAYKARTGGEHAYAREQIIAETSRPYATRSNSRPQE